jgi:hypothetical protein
MYSGQELLWVETNQSDIRIFLMDICIFPTSSWYYANGFTDVRRWQMGLFPPTPRTLFSYQVIFCSFFRRRRKHGRPQQRAFRLGDLRESVEQLSGFVGSDPGVSVIKLFSPSLKLLKPSTCPWQVFKS